MPWVVEYKNNGAKKRRLFNKRMYAEIFEEKFEGDVDAMYEIEPIVRVDASSPKRARPAEPSTPPARTFFVWTYGFVSKDTPFQRANAIVFMRSGETCTDSAESSHSVDRAIVHTEPAIKAYALWKTLIRLRPIVRGIDKIVLCNPLFGDNWADLLEDSLVNSVLRTTLDGLHANGITVVVEKDMSSVHDGNNQRLIDQFVDVDTFPALIARCNPF